MIALHQPTSENGNNSVIMALVFLPSAWLSDETRLTDSLKLRFSDSTISNTAEIGASPIYTFLHDGVLCNLMHVSAPAPIRNADPEVKNAWLWPRAWDEIKEHRSHFVVSASGKADVLLKAMKIQQLIDAVFSSEPSAIGLVNPSSGVLLPAKLVVSLLRDARTLVMPLFLSCYFAKEESSKFSEPGIFASTKGLAQFGPLEIEARGFKGSVPELYQFLMTFAIYLLLNYTSIKDGDSVGLTQEQKIKLRIEKSFFYPENVYSLYFQF